MSTRTQGFIDKISDAEKVDSVKWMFSAPLQNLADSVVDSKIKTNAEWQAKAGIPARIVRRSVGKCCDWCQALVGTYTYPDDVPDDVYRRHDNCNCLVEYFPGDGKKQNVHTKAWEQETAEDLEARKNFAGVELEPQWLIFKPAETMEEADAYARGVLGLDTVDFKSINIDAANMINEELTKAYNTFGNLNEMGVLDEIRILPGSKWDFDAAYQPAYKSIMIPKGKVRYKTSIARLRKTAIEQNEMGFWITGKPEQSIRHELGHAIEKAHLTGDPEKNRYIEEFRAAKLQEIGVGRWSGSAPGDAMKEAGKTFSFYGLRNNGEAVAEAVAEYMDGNPRPDAKKIVEVVLNGVDI